MRAWVLVAGLWSLPAAAELGGEGPRILWTAPPDCPSQPEVARAVEHFLRQPLGQSRTTGLTIRARVSSVPGRGYGVFIEFSTEVGRRQRRLEHNDCAKLTEAAALVMAMAIDPERVTLGAPEPIAPRASPAPPAGHAPAATVVDRAPARSRPWVWSLAAKGLLQGGPLPGIGGGVGGELGVAPFRSLRVEAVGRYWFTTKQSFAQTTDARAEFWMWSAGLRGCWVHWISLGLAACAGPELGQVTGTGRHLQSATAATDWWAAVTLGLEGTLPIARQLYLMLLVEGGGAFVRPRFGVEGVGQVFRSAPWLGRAGAGLGFSFP